MSKPKHLYQRYKAIGERAIKAASLMHLYASRVEYAEVSIESLIQERDKYQQLYADLKVVMRKASRFMETECADH